MISWPNREKVWEGKDQICAITTYRFCTDNAPVHDMFSVKQFWADNRIIVLKHLLYSQDLTPWHVMFLKVKCLLKRTYFSFCRRAQGKNSRFAEAADIWWCAAFFGHWEIYVQWCKVMKQSMLRGIKSSLFSIKHIFKTSPIICQTLYVYIDVYISFDMIVFICFVFTIVWINMCQINILKYSCEQYWTGKFLIIPFYIDIYFT